MTDANVNVFQAKDTTQIQLDSLVAVMDVLGYRIDRAGATGDKRRATGGFITDNPHLKATRNLGLYTAVKIHNSTRKDWQKISEGWYQLTIGNVALVASLYAVNIFFAKKLVETVKFIKDRKTPNHIRLQSHMVKPANRVYTTLLGLEA